MKNQKIQEMSNEALLKREKTTKGVAGILAGMLIALLSAAIFLCVSNQSSVGLPLLIMPFGLLPILFMLINDVKAVRKELQARNQTL